MRKLYVYVVILLTPILLQSKNKQIYPQKRIINMPVVNLRTAPQAILEPITLPTSMETNPLQCSQLLLGEHVIVHKEIITARSEKWLKISAPQQERYSQELGWHGFPGWIQEDQAIPVQNYPACNLIVKKPLSQLFKTNGKPLCTLSIATRLYGQQKQNNWWEVILPSGKKALIDNDDVYQVSHTIKESLPTIRHNIVAIALQFLDNFYSWGGRSAQNNNWSMSSVDCSSLIQLIYLTHGFQIPRNAHDQFLKSHKIKHGKNLQPGDLVFFDPVDHAIKHPIRMTHVLLYIGDDNLLEATNSGDRKVRIIPFEQRIGVSRKTINFGDISRNVTTRGKIMGQYRIYFGSYCHDKAMLQHLRTKALGS